MEERPLKEIRIKRNRYDDQSLNSRDCERISEICRRAGYNVTVDQAYELWRMHSESLCAGWLGLGEDDSDVFANVRYYFDEVD
jgi:hypothetical protein